jgi:hypothetical protein
MTGYYTGEIGGRLQLYKVCDGGVFRFGWDKFWPVCGRFAGPEEADCIALMDGELDEFWEAADGIDGVDDLCRVAIADEPVDDDYLGTVTGEAMLVYRAWRTKRWTED